MSKVSLVEKHKSSKSLPISSLENRNLITIFAGGIVNPMGPTLSVLALDGKAVIGAHLPILHISLNPFSSFVKEIGVVKCGEEWINTESILPLLSNNFRRTVLKVGSPLLLTIHQPQHRLSTHRNRLPINENAPTPLRQTGIGITTPANGGNVPRRLTP